MFSFFSHRGPERPVPKTGWEDEIVLEGWIEKRGSRFHTWKRRWARLYINRMEYAAEPNAKLLGVWHIGDYLNIAHERWRFADRPNCLCLVHPSADHRFFQPLKDLNAWIESIDAIIHSCLPTVLRTRRVEVWLDAAHEILRQDNIDRYIGVGEYEAQLAADRSSVNIQKSDQSLPHLTHQDDKQSHSQLPLHTHNQHHHQHRHHSQSEHRSQHHDSRSSIVVVPTTPIAITDIGMDVKAIVPTSNHLELNIAKPVAVAHPASLSDDIRMPPPKPRDLMHLHNPFHDQHEHDENQKYVSLSSQPSSRDHAYAQVPPLTVEDHKHGVSLTENAWEVNADRNQKRNSSSDPLYTNGTFAGRTVEAVTTSSQELET
eukprot:TRINITY_DN9292_c1_g2_i1.p1 TRINITY_DN9292_c1_g2~~TRINITY_DN9292_c1_g2_i1.p1  ORF type:complete len:373 (+),score=87.64 TRINITY_DN9292_c1_g2_i1:107-1225(+)